MASVKTAIAVPQEVHNRADEAAREMNLSRSALFTLAMEQLLERRETQEMIRQINEAYADGLDEEEKAFLDAAARSFARIADPW